MWKKELRNLYYHETLSPEQSLQQIIDFINNLLAEERKKVAEHCVSSFMHNIDKVRMHLNDREAMRLSEKLIKQKYGIKEEAICLGNQ
jgi:hypothetical protein